MHAQINLKIVAASPAPAGSHADLVAAAAAVQAGQNSAGDLLAAALAPLLGSDKRFLAIYALLLRI